MSLLKQTLQYTSIRYYLLLEQEKIDESNVAAEDWLCVFENENEEVFERKGVGMLDGANRM